MDLQTYQNRSSSELPKSGDRVILQEIAAQENLDNQGFPIENQVYLPTEVSVVKRPTSKRRKPKLPTSPTQRKIAFLNRLKKLSQHHVDELPPEKRIFHYADGDIATPVADVDEPDLEKTPAFLKDSAKSAKEMALLILGHVSNCGGWVDPLSNNRNRYGVIPDCVGKENFIGSTTMSTSGYSTFDESTTRNTRNMTMTMDEDEDSLDRFMRFLDVHEQELRNSRRVNDIPHTHVPMNHA
mmetsp:Transcript_1277/g.1867  ORF Transcript_1277/g.1867 Transcript_1277/m.1867 type:complete len:240 (-) Transcript_1277:41-760(-)